MQQTFATQLSTVPSLDPVKILVIDPDPLGRARVTSHCEGARFLRLDVAATLDEALSSERRPDVVFFDVGAAGSPEALPAHLERLRDRSDGEVVVTSRVDDLRHRVAAARAGAALFLPQPLARHALRDAIQYLHRKQRDNVRRVILIDDDPEFVDMAKAALEAAGYDAVGFIDSEPLLENMRRMRPDAVLLDVGMPRYNGIELAQSLRASPEFDYTPIIFISGNRSPEIMRAGFAAGADDFLWKPISAADLTVRIDARIQRSRQTRMAAERDPLTGLLTRAPFSAALDNRVASALRNDTPLSLCLVDLDHFKLINDSYGHQAGDEVLAAFGRLVQRMFRAEDLKCRWGGEEFALAFPAETGDGIPLELVNRLLSRFSRMRFRGGGHLFSVTFSAGIARLGPEIADTDELIRLADDRLYEAKRGGRARVIGD